MSQEKKEKRNTELMDLCVDLWVCVSLFLDYKTVLSLLRVSKEIYSIFQMKNFSHICRYINFPLNCKSSSIFNKPEEFKELEKKFRKKMFVKSLYLEFPVDLEREGKEQQYRMFCESFEDNMKLSRLLLPKFPNLKKLLITGPWNMDLKGRWGGASYFSSDTCTRRTITLTPEFFKLLPQSLRILELDRVSVTSGNVISISHENQDTEEINFILEDLSRIEKLVLKRINVSKHIGDFKEMKKLKHLRLVEVSFETKICLHLKSLEKLYLGGGGFSATHLDLENSSFEEVKTLTLQEYDLHDLFNETDQPVHFFSKFPNLERLYLGLLFQDRIDEELKYLRKNTLKSLCISNSIITGDCFSTFSKSLEVLEICVEEELSPEFDDFMSKLSVFVNLRVFDFQDFSKHYASNFLDLDLSLQSLSPKLEKLVLYFGYITNTITDDGFSNFRSLKHVDIRYCDQKSITRNLPRILFDNNPNLECLILNEKIKLQKSDPDLNEKLKTIKRLRVQAFPFFKDEDPIFSELRVWGFEEISDEVYCRDCEVVCDEMIITCYTCDVCELERCDSCKYVRCWKCRSDCCKICCERIEHEPDGWRDRWVCPVCWDDDSSSSSDSSDNDSDSLSDSC